MLVLSALQTLAYRLSSELWDAGTLVSDRGQSKDQRGETTCLRSYTVMVWSRPFLHKTQVWTCTFSGTIHQTAKSADTVTPRGHDPNEPTPCSPGAPLQAQPDLQHQPSAGPTSTPVPAESGRSSLLLTDVLMRLCVQTQYFKIKANIKHTLNVLIH